LASDKCRNLLKDTTPDEFTNSILLAHKGDAPLSPRVARYLLKRFAPGQRGSGFARQSHYAGNRDPDEHFIWLLCRRNIHESSSFSSHGEDSHQEYLQQAVG
jgi:hypothetical protein